MPATTMQLCLYDGCTGPKFPIIVRLCSAQALIRKILSDAESEECSGA